MFTLLLQKSPCHSYKSWNSFTFCSTCNNLRMCKKFPLKKNRTEEHKPRFDPITSWSLLPPALTLLRQVILLCLPLHCLTPSLHPLHLHLQQAQEEFTITEAGGGSAWVGQAAGPLGPAPFDGQGQGGVGVDAGVDGAGLGGIAALVVFAVSPLALGVDRAVLCILARWLRLRRVPLEGAAELQGLVLGAHPWEALQLQVCLDARRHTIGALEAGPSGFWRVVTVLVKHHLQEST